MLIIKLGGSVIQSSPLEINPQLIKFLDLIKKSNEQVLIINGGGQLCRLLQNTLKENSENDIDSLDRIGLTVNNTYGEFLRLYFPSDKTYPNLVITDTDIQNANKVKYKYQFFVGGAWKTGHSSDYDAVIFALGFGEKQILRITNVDYVYDKDPKLFADARKIEKMDWEEYMHLIGSEFKPGGNYPFDPIASRLAMENRIKIYLTKIDKVIEKNNLSFKNFKGSVIG